MNYYTSTENVSGHAHELYPENILPRNFDQASSALWRGLQFTMRTIYETPAEAGIFALAAIVTRLFFSSLVPPFIGICLSLVFTRVAVKALDQYYNVPLLHVKKQVCLINKKYPRIQLMAFITALFISLFSQTLGFAMGIIIGAWGSTVLDVENYKMIQQAKRRQHIDEGRSPSTDF